MSRLELLDWRRRVSDLYAEVRACTDPHDAHRLWVARREQLYESHPQSAARGLTLRYAPYRDDLRFVATVTRAETEERIAIATGTDGVVSYERVGTVSLGDVGKLDVWWAAVYGGGIWLPVRDASGHTYGGGRYVLDTVKGADLGSHVDAATGRTHLIVDFNFAYNPSCAYDPAWTCPLAPPGNVVDVALDAGELLPAVRAAGSA